VSLLFLSPVRSLAVVDERVVAVGDSLAAGTVVQIQSEGVLVRGRTGTWLYRLDDPALAPGKAGSPAPIHDGGPQ